MPVFAWVAATLGLTAMGASIAAQPKAGTASPATVTVDFSQSRGAFVHPERYNNFSRARTFPEQRDADVAFLLENGLRGQVYKVWVDAHLILDPKTGVYDYSGITDYLADASRLSEELLVVMDTRVMVRDNQATPEQVKPIVRRIMLDLKRQFPQIRYVEAFNEPDHNLAKALTPEALYDHYKVYYEAINEINAELKPAVPLEIGGPGFMQYNYDWMPVFLDRYAADPSPAKRLDFISWHGYGRFPAGTGATSGPRAYHFYKTDPSEVVAERGKVEAELAKRGLNTNIPAFITETGIYPGPSFDNAADPRPDYLIGAAGVMALHYWYIESPNTYPFNWVVRHFSEERKDQLVTRAGQGNPIPTRTFTPYGNAMAMMAKLKDERVAARSSALADGKGVYAIATTDRTGAAVMIWNYQHTGTQSYAVTLDLGKLPPALRGKTLRQKVYRIDDKVSNYWSVPATANLQMVAQTTVRARAGLKLTTQLTPNALQLVVLEPASTAR